MKDPYVPISCNFHDILLDRSTRQKPVVIKYRTREKIKEVKGRIKDVFTQDKVEYLKLNEDLLIRLDHLISVDDELLEDYGTC